MARSLLLVLGLTTLSCTTRPIDPCSEVDCGPGHCVVDRGAPACLCDEHTRADGLSCVSVDACEGISCDGLPGSVCTEHEGRAACACLSDALPHEGSCVLKTACFPNPCAQPRRTTCAVVGGAATCLCDRGYAPEGSGCSELPVWSCATKHSGPGQDAAEPDECPPLAPSLAAMTVVDRNLEPEGDHDWFQLETTAGFISWVEAVSSVGEPLLIEVFDESGTQLLAADNRGLDNAGVGFVSAEGRPAMVRVRAVSATGTGPYVAAQRSLGRDDFTGEEQSALSLSPGTRFEGAVQFPGDVDRMWLDLPRSAAVRLVLSAPHAVIELRREDGLTRTIHDGEELNLTVPTEERLLLTAGERTAGEVGPFSLTTTLVGPDDHAAEPAFATPLTPDGLSTAGVLETADDVDLFAVSQLAGHVYRARWQALSGTSLPALTVLDPGGAVLARSTSGQVTLGWKATAAARVTLAVTDSRINTVPGAYSLAVDDLGLDDHADSADGATPLQLGTPVSGRVDLAADLDVFTATLPVGHLIRATVTTPIPDAPLVVSIQRPSGETDNGTLSVGLVVTSSGPHLITVRAPVAALTPYTLVLTDEGADDHGDTVATATPLVLDSWATGATQFLNDADVFSFNALQGHVYRLSCEHAAASWPCTVLNASGAPVFGPVLRGDATFFTPVGGPWALSVLATELGTFRVRVDDLGLDDHSGSPAGATLLGIATPLAGRADFEGDRDVFRVNATARRIYELTHDGSTALALQLIANDGSVLRETRTGTLRFAAEIAGPSFVSVLNRSAAVSTYDVTLTELGLDDHGETAAGATPLTLGATISGALDFEGDVDAFRAAVQPGRHLRARCAPTAGWCSLRVRDAGGRVLAESLYEDNPADLYFRAPAGSTEAFVELSSSAPTGYGVSVVDLGADDVGDGPAEATPLSLDAAPLTRSLEVPGDVDVFSVSALAGDVVAVSCESVALQACEFVVRSPAGTALGAWVMGFRASTAGVYTVAVSNEAGRTGSYRISVATSHDDHGNNAATATALVLGQAQPGRIDYAGDVDFFSITLAVGQHVSVETDPSCFVRVRNPLSAIGNFSGGFDDFDVEWNGVHTLALTNCTRPYTLRVLP